MHRYLLKQKFFALGDDYTITDEDGGDVFKVDGRVFAWGDKLSFLDAKSGDELAFISQKLLTARPKYELYRSGELFAEVTKEFSWFNTVFSLDVPGPNDYEISGDFWDREYEFKRGDRIVARVTRKAWSLTDSYTVEVVDDEDDVTILSTAVIVDLVCHEDQAEKKGD